MKNKKLPAVINPTLDSLKILKGQKALITGASSGIGKAIAISLGRAGADIGVNYASNDEEAEAVCEEIRKFGSKAIAIKADVSKEDQVLSMYQQIYKAFGTVDILVSNAGVQRDSPLEKMSLDQWNAVLSIDLTGQFLCCREAIKEFKRRGVKKEISCAAGKIICMSSVHQVIPWAGHVNYASSKGGVHMMMQSIAQEVAPYRIRVNAIAPGAIRTAINTPAWSTPEAYKSLMTLIPYNRIGEPEDIAHCAVWLLSDYADYITGTTIFIDGGMTLFPGFAAGGERVTSTQHYFDIIIIGSGAGGGTLAHKLAPSGKKILMIERGSFLPREKENWQSKEVFLTSRYSIKEKWVDKKGKEFIPGAHYYVGGNTKFYGAALLRMREKDFVEVKHYGGISPAWPLSYQDFEPYYAMAEKLYHVHGERGIDPTEPPSTSPFPYPSVTHEPRIERLYKAFEREGYRPFPLPLGLILDEKNRQNSPCIKCNTCDGFPCLVNAKADAQIVCVNEALKYPNVSLITEAYVERLETSPSGREVSQVIVKRHSHSEIYKGAIVIVACGAINSAALLLRSGNEKHPNGLANGSDCVGRFYMCHNNSALIAITTEPNPTQFQKTMAINDFYYKSSDFDFPLGHIQMLGKADANMFKADAPFPTPKFLLRHLAFHSVDFWLTTEDLPDPNNRVQLTSEGHIQLSYTENNSEGHRRLTKKLKEMLSNVGVRHHIINSTAYFGKKIPLAGVGHQNGTVRFGKDPSTSVLDLNCKAHELDNLYVVDSGFFKSSSAVNPTLTIIANALRVGEHLLERMK